MNARRLLPLMLALAALAGCKRPLEVVTRGRIVADVPPVLDRGPVMQVTVTPGASSSKIALIDVDGLLLNTDMVGLYSLGENPIALFREKLQAASHDPCVKAVVLRINSPGGGVTASDIMRHELEAFKARSSLPVVACLMDVAAGGAYYLATGSDHIVAHPTSVTGGMGVILNLYNMQDALAQFNILSIPVRAGEHVDLGSPEHGLEPEAREILQAMADEFHARYRQTVSESRPLTAEHEEDDFDGRVFTAQQALAKGLVDQVGYVDDAVRIATELAGTGEARVVLFRRCGDAAHTPYAITPNVPQQSNIVPFSLPGYDRSRLPAFLYLWQPEPTMFRLGGT